MADVIGTPMPTLSGIAAAPDAVVAVEALVAVEAGGALVSEEAGAVV